MYRNETNSKLCVKKNYIDKYQKYVPTRRDCMNFFFDAGLFCIRAHLFLPSEKHVILFWSETVVDSFCTSWWVFVSKIFIYFCSWLICIIFWAFMNLMIYQVCFTHNFYVATLCCTCFDLFLPKEEPFQVVSSENNC